MHPGDGRPLSASFESSGRLSSAQESRGIRWLAILAVLTFAARHFTDNKADVDLWGNVGFVTALPWQHGFHRANTYAYTEPNHPWINHEWLGQYLMNRTYVSAGSPGLLALKTVLGFAVLALMHRTLQNQGVSGSARFLLMLLVVSTMGYGFSTRPHHFTYLLTALFLWVFHQAGRARWRWMLTLPPLMILWANLHGAFFAGVLLVAVHLAATGWEGRRRKTGDPPGARRQAAILALVFALCVAATWVNPYGGSLWRFVAYSATIPRPYLSEWAPLWQTPQIADHLDFLALSLLVALGLRFSRHRKSLGDMTVLAGFFIAAVLMRRNIPLFALSAGFLAGPHLDSAWGDRLSRLLRRPPLRPARAPVLALIIILSTLHGAAWGKTDPLRIELRPGEFPVTATRLLRKHGARGHALVFFDWAEYVIWHLHPQVRVFLDGRLCCAYSKPVIRDYLEFVYAGPGWRNALDRYPTDIVLIHPGNPVLSRMLGDPEWDKVHQDDHSVLFLRRAVHGNLADRLRANAMRDGEKESLFFP